jgi:hypothetical protein
MTAALQRRAFSTWLANTWEMLRVKAGSDQ